MWLTFKYADKTNVRMNYYDYAWDKAVKIALRCLAEGNVTKTKIREWDLPFADAMIFASYPPHDPYYDEFLKRNGWSKYGYYIAYVCAKEIPLRTSYKTSLSKEIRQNIGSIKQYAITLDLDYYRITDDLLLSWAWDTSDNPKCILLQPEFWDEVWAKLPEGKMSGYQTRTPRRRAPAKKCPVKVDFRKML